MDWYWWLIPPDRDRRRGLVADADAGLPEAPTRSYGGLEVEARPDTAAGRTDDRTAVGPTPGDSGGWTAAPRRAGRGGSRRRAGDRPGRRRGC